LCLLLYKNRIQIKFSYLILSYIVFRWWHIGNYRWILKRWLGLDWFMMFNTIRGGQFYWSRKLEYPEKTTDLSHNVVSSTLRLSMLMKRVDLKMPFNMTEKCSYLQYVHSCIVSVMIRQLLLVSWLFSQNYQLVHYYLKRAKEPCRAIWSGSLWSGNRKKSLKSNTNPTKNREWTQVFRKGRHILLL
jgi:hypothetical protein